MKLTSIMFFYLRYGSLELRFTIPINTEIGLVVYHFISYICIKNFGKMHYNSFVGKIFLSSCIWCRVWPFNTRLTTSICLSICKGQSNLILICEIAHAFLWELVCMEKKKKPFLGVKDWKSVNLQSDSWRYKLFVLLRSHKLLY